MKVIKNSTNLSFRETMINRLERRWKTWEQPLLLLSFLLHPNYRHEKFTSTANINYVSLGEWIIYYYSAWFGNTPNSILYELDMYRKQLYPFNIATFNNFKGNVLNYWEFVASNSQFELPKLACHIFAVAVNTASVERLFSSMGFLHSQKRNRLNNDKILAMCQLRGELHRMHQLTKLKKLEERYNNTNTNKQPKISQELDNIYLKDTNEDNVETFFEDLDNGSEDDEIEDEDAMQQVIDKWIEMLEDEVTENIEPISDIIVENNQSLDEILTQEHPCQNCNAKWSLENLFIAELEPPMFINQVRTYVRIYVLTFDHTYVCTIFYVNLLYSKFYV